MEEVQMTKSYRRKCSTTLAIREMQIKTTLRFNLTPDTTQTTKNVGEPAGKRNLHTLQVRLYACIITIENSMDVP
jgi:hypothetical protein